VKANNYIPFLFFWLLGYPLCGVAQQPFLLDKIEIPKLPQSPVIVSINLNDTLVVNSEISRILIDLSSHGYFNSTIDSLITNDTEQTEIYFSTGLRSKFSGVWDFRGNSYCTNLENEYYSTLSLTECLNNQISHFNDSGFPFASISISNIIQSSDQEIDVTIDVDPGDKIFLNGIRFTGNKFLSNSLLSDMAGWKKDELFTISIIEKSLSSLRMSEYVSDVNYRGLQNRDSTYQLVLNITEVRSSVVDILLGLEPKVNEGYRIVGQGSLQLNHLFTQASRLDIDFNRSGSSENNLSLLYDQFRINRLPIGYALGVKFSQIDSSYLSIHSEVITKWKLDSIKEIQVDLGYNRIRNSENSDLVIQPNQSRLNIGIGFQYDTRNNWFIATNGTLLSANIAAGIVSVLDKDVNELLPKSYRINSFQLELKHHIPLLENVVLVPEQSFFHTIQNRYYDSDQIRFGGTNSMRGFRENQFRLAGYSLTTVEARWMLDPKSYLYSFGSAAYIWEPDQLGIENYNLDYNFLYSTGFGISYKVRPGIFNISYAISSDDSWLNGKIHFGITNSF
jgi:outer membrane protein assembly factor BamA